MSVRDVDETVLRRARRGDVEAENRLLRQQLEEIKQGAMHNVEVLQRFNEREVALLSADGLPTLLNTLTGTLRRSFQIDELSVVIVDAEYDIRDLLEHAGARAETYPEVRFVEDIAELSPVYNRLTGPALGPWVPYEHARIFKRQDLRSVALLPMERRRMLIGSLNFGSCEADRFTRAQATDFLGRMATIAAVCLENAVNHERLVLSGLTDALTGLYNRRYLTRRLEEELARAQRYACASSRRACVVTCARRMSRCATAARSSRCCCRRPQRARRRASPNACARPFARSRWQRAPARSQSPCRSVSRRRGRS